MFRSYASLASPIYWEDATRDVLHAHGGVVAVQDVWGGLARFDTAADALAAALSLASARHDARFLLQWSPWFGASPTLTDRQLAWEACAPAPLRSILVTREFWDALSPMARAEYRAEPIGSIPSSEQRSSLLRVVAASSDPSAVFRWRSNLAISPIRPLLPRTALAHELSTRHETHRILQVVGEVGAGKSTLLHDWILDTLCQAQDTFLRVISLERVTNERALARTLTRALDVPHALARIPEGWAQDLGRALQESGVQQVALDQVDELDERARAALAEILAASAQVRWILVGRMKALDLEEPPLQVPGLTGDEAFRMLEHSLPSYARAQLMNRGAMVAVVEALERIQPAAGLVANWALLSADVLFSDLLDGRHPSGHDVLERALPRYWESLPEQGRACLSGVAICRTPASADDIAAISTMSEDPRDWLARLERLSWIRRDAAGVHMSSYMAAAVLALVPADRLVEIQLAHAELLGARAMECFHQLDLEHDVPAQRWLMAHLADVEYAIETWFDADPERALDLIEGALWLYQREIEVLPYEDLVDRALAKLPSPQTPRHARLLLCRSEARTRSVGGRSDARDCLDQARAILDSLPAEEHLDTWMRYHALVGVFLNEEYTQEAQQESRASLKRAIDLAQRLDSPRHVAHWTCHLAHSCFEQGDIEEGLQALERAQALASEIEHTHLKLFVTYTAQMVASHAQDREKSRGLAQDALALAEILEQQQHLIIMGACVGYSEIEHGRFHEAFGHLRLAESRARAQDFHVGRTNCRFLLGLLDLIVGHADRAVRVLGEVVGAYRLEEIPMNLINGLPWLAIACEETGDHGRAQELWAELLEGLEKNADPRKRHVYDALRALGESLRGERALETLRGFITNETSPRRLFEHLILRHIEGAPVRHETGGAAGPLVRIANDYGAFHVEGMSEPVDISRRRSMRKILGALTTAALFEVGWPGESTVEDSGRARVYVAITTLRKMGLSEVLIREDSGYFLAGRVLLEDPRTST